MTNLSQNAEKKQNLKVLDCTIRDGGYINNWDFSTKLVREAYRSLSKSGVDIIEIGFRGTEKYFEPTKYGKFRFTSDQDILEAISGIQGIKIAVMGDYGKISHDDFLPCSESPVDMVRIASHKNTIFQALELVEKIKDKGYEVSLNAMGWANYSADERDELVKELYNHDIDYVYAADSYGSIFPEQIEELISPLMGINNIKVGFHPHNNLQMSFANTIRAIDCGVDIVDSTLFGMGRGAGNLQTEILLYYMQMINAEKYNVIPVLNFIELFIMPLYKKNSWGYQLPFMLSGINKCHPNYVAKLLDLKEYNIEDICKAVEIIKEYDAVGFSHDVLDEVIEQGLIGEFVAPVNRRLSIKENSDKKVDVPYVNRHKGRDFLILANGPSLKQYKDKIDELICLYDPIILGANYLDGLFVPHYHAFNNKNRFMMYSDTVDAKSNLLIGQNIPESMINEYVDREYEKIFFNNTLNADFSIVDGVIQTNCKTISLLLLGVAIVMGAERIWAVGMDGYINIGQGGKRHFYNENSSKTDEKLILNLHRWCELFLSQINSYYISQGKEGIHILTPTAYKHYYKGIDNYLSVTCEARNFNENFAG